MIKGSRLYLNVIWYILLLVYTRKNHCSPWMWGLVRGKNWKVKKEGTCVREKNGWLGKESALRAFWSPLGEGLCLELYEAHKVRDLHLELFEIHKVRDFNLELPEIHRMREDLLRTFWNPQGERGFALRTSQNLSLSVFLYYFTKIWSKTDQGYMTQCCVHLVWQCYAYLVW